MKKAFVKTILLAAVAALSWAPLPAMAPAMASGHLYWHKDFQQGLKAAQQSRKWVFVVISAEWCGPCRALHANILPDPSVESFLSKNFVSIDLNADDSYPASMLEKYGAPGIPCLMVFSPTGQFKGKFVGAPSSADSFIRTVSTLVAGR